MVDDVGKKQDILTLIERLRGVQGIDSSLIDQIHASASRLQETIEHLANIRSLLLNKRGRDVIATYVYPVLNMRDVPSAGVIAPSPIDTVLALNDAFLLSYGCTEEEIRTSRERILLPYDERDEDDKKNALIGIDYVSYFRGGDVFGDIIRRHFRRVEEQIETVYIKEASGEYHEAVLDKLPIICPIPFGKSEKKVHICTVFALSEPNPKVSRELEEKLTKARKAAT